MKSNLLLAAWLAFALPLATMAQDRGFAPPAKGLDVPFETASMSADKCTALAFEYGSQACVPADAFVDGAGKKVTGEVQVRFRYLRTPADFIASGAPLHYRTGGRTEQFESAGMFEIYASQGGKELALSPGKKIKVRMPASSLSAGVQPYVWDARAKNWAPLTTPVTITNPSPTESARTASGSFDERIAPPDTTSIGISGEDDFGLGGEGDGEYTPPDPLTMEREKRRAELFRDMEIDKMGLHNFDVVYDKKDAVFLSVTLDAATRTALGSYYTLYVVYKEINSAYYFPSNGSYQFYMLHGKDYKLIAIGGNRRMAVLKGTRNTAWKPLAGKTYEFKLEVLPDPVDNVAQLAMKADIK
jgi:hypothetical protein